MSIRPSLIATENICELKIAFNPLCFGPIKNSEANILRARLDWVYRAGQVNLDTPPVPPAQNL